METIRDITEIHYDVDTKPKKVYKKAKKLGYEVKSLSRGVAHFEKDGQHFVTVKGTNPLNLDDLKSDASIGLGTTKTDAQFKKRRKAIKKIYKSIPNNESITLTGHSLGGSIVTSAMAKSKSIRDRTDKAHTFNTGYTKAFHKELRKDLSKEDRDELNDKITHHRINNDVVSEQIKGGSIGKVKNYTKKNGDILENHSLDAFVFE